MINDQSRFCRPDDDMLVAVIILTVSHCENHIIFVKIHMWAFESPKVIALVILVITDESVVLVFV